MEPDTESGNPSGRERIPPVVWFVWHHPYAPPDSLRHVVSWARGGFEPRTMRSEEAARLIRAEGPRSVNAYHRMTLAERDEFVGLLVLLRRGGILARLGTACAAPRGVWPIGDDGVGLVLGRDTADTVLDTVLAARAGHSFVAQCAKEMLLRAEALRGHNGLPPPVRVLNAGHGLGQRGSPPLQLGGTRGVLGTIYRRDGISGDARLLDTDAKGGLVQAGEAWTDWGFQQTGRVRLARSEWVPKRSPAPYLRDPFILCCVLAAVLMLLLVAVGIGTKGEGRVLRYAGRRWVLIGE